MTDSYQKGQAKALLAEVPSEKVFNLKDGGKIRSISELYSMLQGMDESVFSHHVNSEKNDFGNWIRDVHKDYRLADSLFSAKTRDEAISAVGGRIYELEKSLQKSCTSLVVKQEESASERLEKILSEAAKAKYEAPRKPAVESSSKVTAQQLLSGACEDAPESEVLASVEKGSASSQFFSEMSSIFSGSTFKSIAKDFNALFTRKQDEGLKFLQEMSAFSAYSVNVDDRKGEIISHLKKVYR
jgi:hypothetical protein